MPQLFGTQMLADSSQQYEEWAPLVQLLGFVLCSALSMLLIRSKSKKKIVLLFAIVTGIAAPLFLAAFLLPLLQQ